MREKTGTATNIYDVAKSANVAYSTVSNVLTNKKFVSEEMKQRVFEACRKLNYKPNFLASTLVTRKTGILGLFLETAEDFYSLVYPALIKGVGLHGSHHGYSPILFFNLLDKSAFSAPCFASTGLLDGAIILAPIENDFRIAELHKDNVPMVVIGTPPGGFDFSVPYADSDNREDTYTVTKHLLDNGHRNIAFLNSRYDMTISQHRTEGFIKAYEEIGVPYDARLVFNISTDESAAYNLLSGLNPSLSYTACITESNVSAKGVYAFARDKGLKIGVDFAVASLSGMREELFSPELTTVCVDFEEVGVNAINLLKKIIEAPDTADIYCKNKSDIFFGKSSNFVVNGKC